MIYLHRAIREMVRGAFEHGVRWADENPKPRTISAAEFDQMETTLAPRAVTQDEFRDICSLIRDRYGVEQDALDEFAERIGIEVETDE